MSLLVSYKLVDDKSLHKPGNAEIIKCNNTILDDLCEVYPKVLSTVIFEYSHDIIVITICDYSRGMREIQIDTENVLHVNIYKYLDNCKYSFFASKIIYNMDTIFGFYNYYMKQRYNIDNYFHNVDTNEYKLFKNVNNDHEFIIINKYDYKYTIDIKDIEHFEKCMHITKLLFDTMKLKVI